ncbi:MAG TPA: flagellar filament capping protein FliD [Solirubrobacteraceae bacterium]|jgi:flagellar hook-associated protein 2|nr:flagellar filament capping protein FliD [Solirubrobacteraceae bacterium]
MSAAAISSAAGSPLTISGLASGLDTSAIISALMSVERAPVTRLTGEQEKLQGQQQQLQSVQQSLQQLAFSAAEFSLPSLFETSQTVTSSEPTRVSAATTSGAGIGGHEVEVTQLANSAQRTFTFASPAAEDTLTIDGNSFTVKAGESVKELASAINSDSSSTVYAAVLEGATLVLSNRATGNTGAEFIKVSDPGGVLSEQAGTAKEGKNAEYKVDGVAGTSASNIVSNAIAGVTLTLNGLTTTGPVTIDVQAPGASVSTVESQVQAFIKLYNSTVEAIQKQLTTKPLAKPKTVAEYGTGSLFGDFELESVLSSMRQSMYESVAGLPAEMSSPGDIGIGTGAATGGGTSQSAIEGQLTLNATKLKEAVQANPAGVEQMLQKWSQGLQSTLNAVAEPGGGLETRANGDGNQITEMKSRIATMNELLLVREKALQVTYAELESVMSKNSSQASWLTSQTESLNASGI